MELRFAIVRVSDILQDSKIPKTELKILLKYVLKFTDVELITCDNYELTAQELQLLHDLIIKYQEGVPIQYLLGVKEFYSRDFLVNVNVLIPRFETELLVEQVLRLAKDGDRILDLGTGSGCIAITCKLENPSLRLSAVDNSWDALLVAKENASLLHAQVNFIYSDWFSSVDDKFNIIVSNPPYIAYGDVHLKNLTYEPQVALTDFADGFNYYRQIIAESGEFLEEQGYLILEHGYNQAEQISIILQQNNFVDICTIKDYASQDRITFGRKVL